MNVNNNLNTNQSKIITLWVNNQQYLVTESFLQNHPGGYTSIYQKDNQDCTRDYNFHSKKGQQLWKKFLVHNEKEQDHKNNNGFDCNIL